MNSSLHTIRKQCLQFQYNGKADGFALQKEVSDWCNFKLIPEIERQFDSLDLGDHFVTIDKLVIEATVNENDWKQKILEELIWSLKQKLSIYNPSIKGVNSVKSEAKITKLDELFAYYFENGYLPWWSKSLINNNFESVFRNWILEDMPLHRSKSLIERLKQTASNSQVKRIINLVPQELFFKLLKNIYQHETERIGQIESFFKEEIVNKISNAKESAKYQAVTKAINSFLLTMMIKNEGIIDVNLMFQFLYDEVYKKKNVLKETISLDFVKILENANPLKNAWQEFLIFKKKEKEPRDIGDVLNNLSHSISLQIEKKDKKSENTIGKQIQEQESGITDVNEKEKFLQYNKLIDQLTNRDIAKKISTAFVKEFQEGIYIENAGAVIFAAFIPTLFKQLKIEKDEKIQHPSLAAMIVQYCVTGKAKIAEYELVLPKVLCGLDIEFPVNTNTKISTGQMKEVDEMLLSLIEYWAVLKNTSIDGLRESFLKRNGKLSRLNDEWLLQVEQKPFDMLVQQLPWSISMIKLPWMTHLLKTEWV
jgi:hypothetical protein